MNSNEYYLCTFAEMVGRTKTEEQIETGVQMLYPGRSLEILDELYKVKVVVNRKASKYGHAAYARGELMLAERILKPGQENHLLDTWIHEIAHFVNYYGEHYHGHGPLFRRSMRALGIDPEDTHKHPPCPNENAIATYECIRCNQLWHRSRRVRGSLTKDPNTGRLVESKYKTGYFHKCIDGLKGTFWLVKYKGHDVKQLWERELFA